MKKLFYLFLLFCFKSNIIKPNKCVAININGKPIINIERNNFSGNANDCAQFIGTTNANKFAIYADNGILMDWTGDIKPMNYIPEL